MEYRYGTMRYRGITLSSASPATNPAPGKYRNRKANRNKKINAAFVYIPFAFQYADAHEQDSFAKHVTNFD